MKKYKVVALSVGADSNKIFYAGDIVSADAWSDENMAEELAKQGFLEPIESSENEPLDSNGDSESDIDENMAEETETEAAPERKGRGRK